MKSISKLKDEARRHEQKEEWEKAIEAYLRALQVEGDGGGEIELPLYNRVGDLCLRLGRPAEAVKHYEQAADRYAEAGLYNNAIALCNKALRYDPDRLELLRKLGQFSASQGFLTDARRYFLEFAERQFATGGINEALTALEDFAEVADDPDIREMLGRQLQSHGRSEEAVQELRKAYQARLQAGDTTGAEAVKAAILEIDAGAVDLGREAQPPRRSAREGAGRQEIPGLLDIDSGTPPRTEPPPAPAATGPPPPAPPKAPPTAVAPDLPADLPTDSPDGFMLDATSWPEGEISGVERFESTRSGGTDDTDDFGPFELSGLDLGHGREHEDRDSGAAESHAGGLLDLGPNSLDFTFEGIATEGEFALDEPDVDVRGGGAFELPTLADAFEATGEFDLSTLDDDLRALPEDDLPGLPEDDLPGLPDDDLRALADDDLPGLPDDDLPRLPDDDLPRLPDDDVWALADDDLPGLPDAVGEADPGLPLLEDPTLVEAVELSGLEDDVPEPAAQWSRVSDLPLLDDEDTAAVRPHDRDAAAAAEALDRIAEPEESSEAFVPEAATGPVELAGLDEEPETELAEPDDDDGSAAALLSMDNAGRVPAADAIVDVDVEDVTADTADRAAAPADAATEEWTPDMVLPAKSVPRPAAAPVPPAGVSQADEAGYVDLGSLLADDEPETTRFRVAEKPPTGDEDRDFAELLTQFKAKVSEHIGAEDATAHYDLGLAFKDMGLIEEAIAEFQIAMRSGDIRLKVYEELGQCFLLKDQFNIAEKVLARALNMKHSDELELIGVYYHIGKAYEGMGRRDAARDAYERVLGLDINFRDVSERLAAL